MLAGVALSVAISVPAVLFLAPIPGSVATIIGSGLGGFLAGKWAKSAGVVHGSYVGAAWILFEAFGVVPSLVYSSDTLTDTLITFAVDFATLVAAAFAGWWAQRVPSSSSGMGRGR